MSLVLALLLSATVPTETTAPLNLWVDPSGNDANSCTNALTPCLTIQGAFSQIPASVRHPVTVTVGPGNYTGAFLAGHTFSPLNALSGSYVALVGSLSTFTPASGTGTGTATAGSNCALGPPLLDASLTDTTQTWLANELTSFELETLTGTGAGQVMPIASNTSNTVTMAGCWTVTPDSTTTYAIRKWDAVITTGTPTPPNYVGGLGSGLIGLGVWNEWDSQRSTQSAFFFVDKMRVNITGTFNGSMAINNSSVHVVRSRFDAGTGASVLTDGASRLNFLQSVATAASSFALTTGIISGSGAGSARIQDAYFESGVSGYGTSVLFIDQPGFWISDSTVRATNTGASAVVRPEGSAFATNFQLLRALCAPGTTTTAGLIVNNLASAPTPYLGSAVISINWDSSAARDCAYGLRLAGANVYVSTDDSTFTGATGTAGVSVYFGAKVHIDTNTTFTGFTNDFVIESLTTNLAGLAAAAPGISAASTGSTVMYGNAPF